ncbi:shikimate dehydrogenase [Pediococcus parvulus]|uniref:Shikimate dehydrogenase (NADP(+)) n=1 Tax=Pediococcus parvulus TaxID=54062 RepID=A0ABX2UEI3_9LACO|nr:shikimate dehydrogenase [Pediococcus parvulus]OAD63600.1 shikimate dehydrogenase [Pediococcus parvulus]
MEKRIDGRTVLLGLFGTPVKHSGSPAMYNYSFADKKINYAYLAFDIKAEEMATALDSMRLFGMRGANVTMPCKQKAAELVDQLSPAAKLVGAVNTIVNDNGILTGYNTDGAGYVQNLKHNGVDVKDKVITLIGAGGAGTAIAVQVALDGAKQINIFNPKDVFFQNAEKTAAKIMKSVPNCQVTVNDIQDKVNLYQMIANSDIFGNATKVGMTPNIATTNIEDSSAFRPGLVVTDTVYSPDKTKMLQDAEKQGATVIGGRGMLIWQGAAAFQLYTGQEMPVDEVKALFFSKE